MNEHNEVANIVADAMEVFIENNFNKPMTNYDRIRSMSVEEMAEMMIEVMETPLSGKLFYITPDGRLFSVREKMKDKAVEHTKQWLLQEVSDE